MIICMGWVWVAVCPTRWLRKWCSSAFWISRQWIRGDRWSVLLRGERGCSRKCAPGQTEQLLSLLMASVAASELAVALARAHLRSYGRAMSSTHLTSAILSYTLSHLLFFSLHDGANVPPQETCIAELMTLLCNRARVEVTDVSLIGIHPSIKKCFAAPLSSVLHTSTLAIQTGPIAPPLMAFFSCCHCSARVHFHNPYPWIHHWMQDLRVILLFITCHRSSPSTIW